MEAKPGRGARPGGRARLAILPATTSLTGRWLGAPDGPIDVLGGKTATSLDLPTY
jgi:hypothetical protein